MTMERTIVKENFWVVGNNGDKSLFEDELGWPEALVADAQSDYPETIFRFVIEISGFNLLFYWMVDGNFYTIETERTPIEVRRIHPNPNWDGKCELLKAGSEYGPNTASAGEVIATFDSPTDIWDNLKIGGHTIGEVLEKSAIITWD